MTQKTSSVCGAGKCKPIAASASTRSCRSSIRAGEQRWLRFVAQPSVAAENEYRGLILDITALKRRESRQAEDEQRLELALVNGSLALVDWDIEGGNLAPNAQLAKLLELGEGDVVATTERLAEYEHPKDKQRMYAELREHLQGGTPEFHCEYRLRTAAARPDGCAPTAE